MDFLTTKHRRFTLWCWAEVKTHTALALWYLSTEVAKEQEKGRFVRVSTGNRKGDKKGADYIPVDFVMFHTKKCLAYYPYTYKTKKGESIHDSNNLR